MADRLSDRHTEPAAIPDKPELAPTEEHRRGSFLKELPVLIVIAFAIALLIKTFLLQAFFIPSASMEPTLLIGDRVLVEKVSYRLGDADRGDVVVFEKDVAALINPAPEEGDPFYVDVVNAFKELFGFPTGSKQDFIKRVIGIGGDVVEGRDGHVFVNGDELEEPYLPEETTTSDFGPVEIPEGMVFVMGDNRANSDDSRGFGPVDEDKIVGRAFVLIWPPADVGTL
ncbi:MAG: signal peptidase I [Actinomycetota bacterium]|nr:signal peptidase I [Actinomycetota bacterium]